MDLNTLKFIVLYIMGINNPFISNISPSVLPFLDAGELIQRSDHESYLIYEETHKVPNPQSFTFLNHQIKFIAFKTGTDNKILSMMVYVENSNELLEILRSEFGEQTGSLSLTGDMRNGNGEQQLQYESISWEQNDYIMMVAPPQNILVNKNDSTTFSLKLNRIWIKYLGNNEFPLEEN